MGFFIVLALIVVLAGGPRGPAFWFAIVGAAIEFGTLFERRRYKPAEPASPGPGWVATGERFVDPQSGEEVSVFFLPATGERRYIAAAASR